MVSKWSILNIDNLKREYLNCKFNDFTIKDIFIIDNTVKCLCECLCGTIKEYNLRYIVSGKSKSCGHRRSTDAPKKISKWRENNPDKLAEISLKTKEWNCANKEVLLERNKNNSQLYKNLRAKTDFTELLRIIHPDYTDDLLAGNLNTKSVIKTKCPVCDEYCEHTFNNVFHIKTGKFKNDRAPCCHNCRQIMTTSSQENELYNFIKSFYKGKCFKNYRDLLYPYELDLYYPEKKIAIEFNGDYWHSIQNGKPDNYHYNKFLKCLNKGVLLVSVFESEWNNNMDNIKSYIIDLFNNKENKLSFNEDYYINNNYPPYNIKLPLGEYISNYYNFGKYTIFTCGFSKIN